MVLQTETVSQSRSEEVFGGASSLKPFGGFKPTLDNRSFGKTEQAFGGFKESEPTRKQSQSVKPFAGFKTSGY